MNMLAETLDLDYDNPMQSGFQDDPCLFTAYAEEIAAYAGLPVQGRNPAATVIDRTFVRVRAQKTRPPLKEE